MSGVFGASTAYTATITLTPKDGYSLAGVAGNSFTVAGAGSVTHGADSGVVTAPFPVTGPNLSPVSDATSDNIGVLIAVQGGTFNNGTANMTVSSFRMSRCEITGEQYAEVTGAADPSFFASVANHPVENVSWYSTLVFCNKLSMQEGLTPVYSVNGSTDPAVWGAIPETTPSAWTVSANWGANGYRLPTEAEWQFAARGGNGTHDYAYAGSSAIGDVAWYYSNSGETTNTVKTKAANELGLYDMSGNVAEWCWDRYAAYPGTDQTDYRGPSGGWYRITRGGHWNCDEAEDPFCTVAFRDLYFQPHMKDSGWGFRVVRP